MRRDMRIRCVCSWRMRSNMPDVEEVHAGINYVQQVKLHVMTYRSPFLPAVWQYRLCELHS